MNPEEHIVQNKILFEKFLSHIKKEKNANRRLHEAQIALNYVWCNSTGYFSSDVLENIFCDFSKSLRLGKKDVFKKQTCLIVLTSSYINGGHTRVVERWIEADNQRHYSVVVTDQEEEETERLKEAVVTSGGGIFVLNKTKKLLEKAQDLRDIANEYEEVLLFQHMYDPLPLIAFYPEHFYRPVGLYNHADHLFWTGISISDCIADLRTWGQKLTISYRGAESDSIIGVPIDIEKKLDFDKTDSRRCLGIPLDKKVIVSAAHHAKFHPANGKDLSVIVEQILLENQDLYYFIIGVSPDSILSWKFLFEKYGKRFNVIPSVPYEIFIRYVCSADLIIDSFPVTGITTLQDAIVHNKPILSLENGIDWLQDDPGHCASISELIYKANALLSDGELRNKTAAISYDNLVNQCGVKSFRQKVDVFMRKLENSTHRLHQFKSIPTVSSSEATLQVYGLWNSTFKAVLSKRYVRLLTIKPSFLGYSLYNLYKFLRKHPKILFLFRVFVSVQSGDKVKEPL